MMPRHQGPQKKSGTQSGPSSEGLAARPFAVNLQPEALESSSESLSQESTPADFAILEPGGGRSLPIQPKLTIGAPGDKYEQEADQVAKQVVQRIHTPDTKPIQRHSHPEDEVQMKADEIQRHTSEEEDDLQMKVDKIQRHASENEDDLQRKPTLQLRGTSEATTAHPDLERSIQQAKGGGSPLDTSTRESMEQAFGGTDFGGVTIHTDATSDQLNRSIQALAFTTGQDIFFRSGTYDPGSRSGQELLAHELTHVVQQNGAAVQRHSEEEEVHRKIEPLTTSSTCTAGCQCASCIPAGATLQRKSLSTPTASAQQRLNPTLATILQRSASGEHSQGCPCSNCGLGRIQLKSDTHTPHCSCSQCGGQREQLQAKLSPNSMLQKQELWAQGSILSAPATAVSGLTGASFLQRHSSWEHQLLGDAQPDELAQIGSWKNLIDQTTLTGFIGFRKRETEDATVSVPGVAAPIKKGNVMHVIAQELQRLNDWQDNPPKEASSGDIDPKYQTVLVSIPGGGKDGGSLIITYGEMNTLADYYGNIDAMKSADPKVRWELIQSVRQETFFRLKDIYEKLKGSLTDTEKTDQTVKDSETMIANNKRANQKLGYKFQDAILQDYISGEAGQINLLTVTGSGAQGNTNEYGATLARNACHFVPESWHAWSGYHQKARKYAKEAYDIKQAAEKIISEYPGKYKILQDEIEQGTNVENNQLQLGLLKQEKDNAEQKMIPEAKDAANEALLHNGFGDHYLQDSYAAGHLINKTQIMQWFVQWLDTQSWTMDFASAETWRKIQQIAYNQPGLSASIYDKTQVEGYDANQTTNRARNPQAVEDIDGDDWKVRFDALGLQVPRSLQTPNSPERKLMEWWQDKALKDKGALVQESTGLLGADSPFHDDSDGLQAALANLMQDRIVRLETKLIGADKYILRTEYMPTDAERFQGALAASKGNEDTPGDDSQYQRMAAAVTYEDYLAFLNNAYLQKSTNALHNVFCTKGIRVYDATKQELFRVYGDDAMFNKDSATGAKHSGETAKMSRDAIRNMIQTGTDGGETTQKILERLPNSVQPDGASSPIDIADWHDPARAKQLKADCEDKVFPSMGIKDKFVALKGSAMSGMSSFISKDKEKIHGSETF